MTSDYYSVDAILAEAQKIQCVFNVDVSGLGYLDGGAEQDLKALSKVQLPFWLARMLLYSDYAESTMPHAFNQRVRNALNADPRSVSLSNLVGSGGLWYGFGQMIMRILDDEQARELSETLTQTFRQRLMDIMDQAQHFGAMGAAAGGGGRSQAGEDFREGLDGTEREIFALAQDSARLTKQWYESREKANR